MEGAWKFNPFYWVALRRLNRANNLNDQSLTLATQPNRLGNFWAQRTMRIAVVGLFAIILPIYVYNRMQSASSLELEGRTMLEIPAINLSTPVETIELEDRQLIAPDTIAGVYKQNENKTFIIGHSSTVFENLNKITLGSNFNYDNKNYIVISISTQEKSEIDMNDILASNENDTIIMMTCAGEPLPNHDATHRLIVTAVRESEY